MAGVSKLCNACSTCAHRSRDARPGCVATTRHASPSQSISASCASRGSRLLNDKSSVRTARNGKRVGTALPSRRAGYRAWNRRAQPARVWSLARLAWRSLRSCSPRADFSRNRLRLAAEMLREQRVAHRRQGALNARIAVCINSNIAFSVEHNRTIVEIRRSDEQQVAVDHHQFAVHVHTICSKLRHTPRHQPIPVVRIGLREQSVQPNTRHAANASSSWSQPLCLRGATMERQRPSDFSNVSRNAQRAADRTRREILVLYIDAARRASSSE